jgi:predicted regulator of Ras-like GTPase activity (Roadblock/LC7/MglB family)
MTRGDLLAGALDDFIAVSPEVEAAAVVSVDGLPMASALPEHVEEERLAAMSAALLILGERAASGMGKGELSQVVIESGKGYVILMSAGPQAVLVAVTSSQTKAGLTLFEMRRTAGSVANLMNHSSTEKGREDERPVPDGGEERRRAPSGDQPSVSTWR